MLQINSHKLMESSQGSWRIYALLVVKRLTTLLCGVVKVYWVEPCESVLEVWTCTSSARATTFCKRVNKIQRWFSCFCFMNIWIRGHTGVVSVMNKDGMHTRHKQSYVCGIWCRDIYSLAGLQECNFFPHWAPNAMHRRLPSTPSAHLNEDQR